MRTLQLTQPPEHGDDVRMLQHLLHITESGTYDQATANAVYRKKLELGYQVPDHNAGDLLDGYLRGTKRPTAAMVKRAAAYRASAAKAGSTARPATKQATAADKARASEAAIRGKAVSLMHLLIANNPRIHYPAHDVRTMTIHDIATMDQLQQQINSGKLTIDCSQSVTLIAHVARTKGWRYQYSWSYRPGSYIAQHDPKAVYRMPWMDGRTFRIGQAPGGRITTHTTPASREAVDITMPEGTPVVAARDGVVIRVAQGFSEGGKDEALRSQANVVHVLHADGTIGEYVHFMNQGVAVRMGEAVGAGKILGYAGSTGYSSGPHLHFAVLRVVREGSALDYVSVPFSFYAGRPPRVFQPLSGMEVRADYESLQKH